MKLLILTQKVDQDDDVLGFFYDWLLEFGKKCEKVTVICLEKGEVDLPENFEVLSLGKEVGDSRLKYLLNFYKYVWQKRKEYDNVFVHMNPEYIVLGGFLWKFWKKKITLWYTHKQVNLKLRIAEKLADIIFTASKESFRLESKKVQVMGHGINIHKFKIRNLKSESDFFRIIYVGRISKIKNQKLLIEAVNELVNKQNIKDLKIKLVGAPVYSEDVEYKKSLDNYVKEKNLDSYIEFVGSVPNKEIYKYYEEADLSVNLCPTGGADKAVLESMASGIPVIVLNKTFAEDLGEYKNELLLEAEDARELAKKITRFKDWSPEKKAKVSRFLRNVVEEGHDLEYLIKNIVDNIK